VSKKVLPTCRYFGISRGTFYFWSHRYPGIGGFRCVCMTYLGVWGIKMPVQ
jgi:hypothetical protein